jgi:hypothetical protein
MLRLVAGVRAIFESVSANEIINQDAALTVARSTPPARVSRTYGYGAVLAGALIAFAWSSPVSAQNVACAPDANGTSPASSPQLCDGTGADTGIDYATNGTTVDVNVGLVGGLTTTTGIAIDDDNNGFDIGLFDLLGASTIGSTGDGIAITTGDGGNIDINLTQSTTIDAADNGIFVFTVAANTVDIDLAAGSTIAYGSSGSGAGISVDGHDGAVTIDTNDTITGLDAGDGIFVTTNSGSITVTTNAAVNADSNTNGTGGDGINLSSSSGGTITVDNSGAV